VRGSVFHIWWNGDGGIKTITSAPAPRLHKRAYRLSVESSMIPQEDVTTIGVVIFILMGLVVIPLIYSYLRRGKETDNVSFHSGDVRERENWLRPGEKSPYTLEVAPATRARYEVNEEWLKGQVEKYEERKKKSQQSE
jgi:hypothetical protein